MTHELEWALVAATLALGGVLLAVAVRRRWLAFEALPAAVLIGAAVVAGGGAGGGLLLFAFLMSTSILTRFRAHLKANDGREHSARSAGRLSRQVWANGGVAAACALLSLMPGTEYVAPGVAGALAAATADSWATEVGTALRGRTLLVTSLRAVEPGTSGGVSVAGTVAGVAGAALIGILAGVAAHLWMVPWQPESPAEIAVAAAWAPRLDLFLAVTLGGVVGMLVDSILGATIEGRYRRLDNEAVNLLATLTGAAVAALAV